LALLVNCFMESASKVLGRKRPTPPKELIPILMNYNYPGNVRELESMITDSVSRHTSRVLSLQSIKEHIAGGASGRRKLSCSDGSRMFHGVLPRYDEVKGCLIEEALWRTDNNHTRAAEMLSVTRQVVWRHVKSLEKKDA